MCTCVWRIGFSNMIPPLSLASVRLVASTIRRMFLYTDRFKHQIINTLETLTHTISPLLTKQSVIFILLESSTAKRFTYRHNKDHSLSGIGCPKPSMNGLRNDVLFPEQLQLQNRWFERFVRLLYREKSAFWFGLSTGKRTPEKGPRKTPGKCKCKCKPDRTLPPPNTHLHICCIHAGNAMPTVVKISNFSFFIIYFATAALMIVFVSEILPEGGMG